MITIEKALELRAPLFIDLRSPCEYEEAHIPGAINIPLFDNLERSLIGTVYRETSNQAAVDKGFEIVAPKLPDIYNQIKPYSSEREIVLYCWRGGMRSQAISQVFDLLELPHCRLSGGYKAFRRHVCNFFAEEFKQEIIVLHGLTGAGKTEMLQELSKKEYPVINLEALANHRGSAFGHIGLGKTPSQKQFEGLLFAECRKHREAKRIAVECESRSIGSLQLPDGFFNAMQTGRKVLVYDSLQNRIERLVATYAESCSLENEEQLAAALHSLRKRLGNTATDDLLRLVKSHDYREVAHRLLVGYYDPLYRYPDKPSPAYELNLNAGDMEQAIASVEKLLTA